MSYLSVKFDGGLMTDVKLCEWEYSSSEFFVIPLVDIAECSKTYSPEKWAPSY
jgi:hypothetical protein